MQRTDTGEMRTRLALVAPSFNLLSETFIADHARTLAPGQTVLLCQDGKGVEGYGYPVLSHIQPKFTGFGPLDTRLKDLRFRLRRRFGPALPFDDRMRVAEFLQAQGAQVVLAEYGPIGVMMADVCADLGLPLYVCFHGIDASALLRHATIRRRYRHLFTRASGIICVSRALADRLVAIGCPERLITVIPCGVDETRFAPGTPEPGRILAIGRLTEKKAPHLTIRAFAAIADRFGHARLDVVGDGPLMDRCRAEVEKAGLGDRVVLHGSQPAAFCREMLGRTSIFAQHSVTGPDGDTEGSPVAIAEAMACAVPVISTRHSGIPEQITEGVSGLLVDEHDVDAMAEAMAQMLSDPDRAARMGAEARKTFLASFTQDMSRTRMRDLLGLPHPG